MATVTKKRQPSAKTILKKSIKDIEAGQWCQGDLYKERDPDTGTPYPKLHACAVGLVAMHGLDGIQEGDKFYFDYPTEMSPEPVRTALRALYDALPKGRKSKWRTGDFLSMRDAVIEYNDAPSTKRTRAAAWFSKALDKIS